MSRSQAERSAATTSLLVEAAIESLVERGWAATTAVEVCARAGLTRGALNHHFDSLSALLAAALRQVYVELVPVDGAAPAGLPELVDHMYAVTRHRRFKAVIEAWLAMANDPSLRPDIEPVVAEFATVFVPKKLSKAERVDYLAAREAIIGLALGRATTGGRALPHEKAVIERLRGGGRR